jgi:hypothetical protein
MDLENLTLDKNPHFENSVKSLQEIETNPEYVSKNLARHTFELSPFKKLNSSLHGSARKELENLVMKYSRGMVVESDGFKREHNQYHFGKLGKILGTGTAVSGLMYALPGRFYPNINGIKGALKYLNPLNIVKDVSKYAFLRGIKGIGSTLFSPFLYLSAGYTLYQVIKSLIKRKKNKNERSKFVRDLSNEELYKTLEDLKRIKNIKEDFSYLRQEIKNDAA